ncbi:hypothetical protein Tco_0257034 [Tanacetum coccineum]
MMVENKCYDELMIDNHWMDKRLKEVLMIDYFSIVETDKVNHAVETDMVKLVVEIENFGMSFDKFDKKSGLSDGLQPKQADLSCVHAFNEPHLHEIHIFLRLKGVPAFKARVCSSWTLMDVPTLESDLYACMEDSELYLEPCGIQFNRGLC